MKLKHYIFLGILSGIVWGICGVGVMHHPIKFLIVTFFYWFSIWYVMEQVGVRS